MKLIGALIAHFEQGSEGIWWMLLETDEKRGFYERLHNIETGDRLTVYGENNEIIFSGEIVRDYEAGWTEYRFNPGYGQPIALGHWIHWTQQGWHPDEWAGLFFRKIPLRAELVKKENGEI